MEVIDCTTQALCGGDCLDFEDDWTGDSLWISCESWVFGAVRQEELAALMALPAAGRVAALLVTAIAPASGGWLDACRREGGR